MTDDLEIKKLTSSALRFFSFGAVTFHLNDLGTGQCERTGRLLQFPSCCAISKCYQTVKKPTYLVDLARSRSFDLGIVGLRLDTKGSKSEMLRLLVLGRSAQALFGHA